MDDDAKEIVKPVGVVGVVDGVEEAELERECNAVGKLNIPPDILLVLEPLEMECEHVRETLNLHAFLGFLEVAAGVTEKLVLVTEHLAGAELAETGGDARVLLDVYGEIEEGLVPGGDLYEEDG